MANLKIVVCCQLEVSALITRPEESYRLWRVVCDLEKQTS